MNQSEVAASLTFYGLKVSKGKGGFALSGKSVARAAILLLIVTKGNNRQSVSAFCRFF